VAVILIAVNLFVSLVSCIHYVTYLTVLFSTNLCIGSYNICLIDGGTFSDTVVEIDTAIDS